MKIEIFGTGCAKCKKLFENAQEAVRASGLEVDIVKIEDIEKIVETGVMMTPALVVDGKIKSTGKVLSVDEIKKILK
jgi:small redox-active disulfide protein 2